MVGTLATVGAISVTAAGSALAASGIVMFAKPSKLSGKETSSEKPSWFNENMLDHNLSAQENAKNILNSKYGTRTWPKGPTSEFNRLVKWIHRYLKYYKRW